MQITTIDWRNFLAGESSADTVPDKGFSPDSYGLNLTKTRGLLYFTETATEIGGATLTGSIIARSQDLTVTTALNKDFHFVDNAGAIYYLDGTTLTKAYTAASDGNFTLGTTDIVSMIRTGTTEVYVTSDDRVLKFSGADLATSQVESFWTGLGTASRHAMEKVEDTIYIADGFAIHSISSTGATTSSTIVLPSDVQITSLRRDPDGVHLLAFCGTGGENFSHTRGGGGRVFYVNTAINDWEREVKLNAQVEGTINHQGTIFCTWGKNLGYFNGTGLIPLKRLVTSATTYSHAMESFEEKLVIRDGTNVLMYGDLGNGNVWWNMHRDSGVINVLAYQGSNILLVGNNASDLNKINYDNAGTAGKFYGNKMYFSDYTNVRRVDILHDTQTGTNYFTLSHRDYTNTEQQFFISNPDIVSATWDKYRVDTDIKDDFFQLVVVPSTGGTQHGYKFFRIFHESI